MISGGPSPGLKAEFWAHLLEAMPAECRVILDTSGSSLGHLEKRSLYIYKSNIEELGRFSRHTINSDVDVIQSARNMIDDGIAQNVVTSLGAGGAVLVTAHEDIHAIAPTVPISSRVGAGDSMTAGIVFALSRQEPIENAFLWGVAAGTAAVMTPGIQLCHRKETEDVFARIRQSSPLES